MLNKKLNEQEISAISQLFSANVIRELSIKGKSPKFARLASQSSLMDTELADGSVSDFYECVFSYLKRKDYRNEYVYKSAITHKILLGKHSLKTAVMLNEFRACGCKADSVILNGTSSVYEIKSERDSLSRLARQVEAYRKVFARVNVIVGEKHLCSVLRETPEDVGVMKLSDRYQISTIRKSLDLPSRTDSSAIFDSIQQVEAKMILLGNGIEIPDVPNMKAYSELRKVFSNLPSEAAHQGMVEVLKNTRNMLPLNDFILALPDSLKNAVISLPSKFLNRNNFLDAINTSTATAIKWN